MRSVHAVQQDVAMLMSLVAVADDDVLDALKVEVPPAQVLVHEAAHLLVR